MRSDYILILEDDSSVAISLSMALELNNFKIFHCATNEAAVKFLSKYKPIILIADFWIQHTTAHPVLEFISKKYGNNEIPVVLMSTGSTLNSIKERVHADIYLEKPFDIDNFMKQIFITLWEKECIKDISLTGQGDFLH